MNEFSFEIQYIEKILALRSMGYDVIENVKYTVVDDSTDIDIVTLNEFEK